MRGCADFIRQDKADAGKDYGAFGVQRLCIRSTEDISGDSGICRSRCHHYWDSVIFCGKVSKKL